MLYIVSTPIGNLDDITYRAVDTLKKVSYIAAEDTRTTGILCKHYNIDTKRVSFHGNSSEKSIQTLDRLRLEKGPTDKQTRTAECDWFGAEETVTLAKAAVDGKLEKAYKTCMPFEIQVIKIGKWSFIGWQGEVFIEYPLAVKQAKPDTFVIALANGELQGYVVTEEAAEEGGYEASNALFSHQSGQIMIDKTIEILDELK